MSIGSSRIIINSFADMMGRSDRENRSRSYSFVSMKIKLKNLRILKYHVLNYRNRP